uniref:Uncharacterized protein n=1 Tax=Odontella aurita TaxID=265563 RepID=A0A7S4IYM4_9STRA|mmetsp:Transcript_33234/g.98786  ORF Transcript_33234/g.98786 Transcript_33234/m.98786 type:complete len:176 (+) Transcript_33234:133-660(+)|eukprot:CAMPEP_0113570948 /NCGR_PEP_ID=MMETSP0015_2-20120614/25279_1 /TAXON_ID=2838 /ORGANISM="Odontella" /LENGTH=175 /DNA_ID=CAMNT_0000473839 /DNA_START=123 /DNA_END=650 /DNA_ORIENTATION=- /assembly_acc=CAM_ASM_000160
MAASVTALLGRLPAPLFGNAATAFAWSTKKASALPRYAGWAVPGAVGALWFVWPAVDDGWKVSVGIMADPEAAAAAKAEAAEAAKVSSPAPAIAVELSQEAKDAIANAHKGSEVTMSAEEKAVVAKVKAGDFSDLEKDWDTFAEKSIVPGEDDDDDDDDDDDEDDDDDDEDEDDE